MPWVESEAAVAEIIINNRENHERFKQRNSGNNYS